MKAIKDRPQALGEGLSAIRTQFQLPGDFSAEVEAAAEAAVGAFERALSLTTDNGARRYLERRRAQLLGDSR